MSNLPDELINPDRYLRPVVHMSPFSGKHFYEAPPHSIDKNSILARCSEILLGAPYTISITRNGREALHHALAATVRSKENIVSIITPSNCGYVSSCVTGEIEKFCRWKFGFEEKASIVILVHEFGRYVETPAYYHENKIPVIEDCAYAMIDRRFADHYGQQGDFIVYSLPKALPLQYGGLLVNKNDYTVRDSNLSEAGKAFILYQLKHHIENLYDSNKARTVVYERMQKLAAVLGIKEAYSPGPKDLAHSFIAHLESSHDPAAIKAHMNDVGIESSVFYGGNGYFIPCHQNLGPAEINYCLTHLRKALAGGRTLS